MNTWSTIAPEIRRNSSWRGASVADSPREVVENSDIIITMLPGPPEVEEVVAGEAGLLEGTVRGSLIVDMSTSSPGS